MPIHDASKLSRFILPLTVSLAALAPTLATREAAGAPLIVVTPGEQNTQSGENGCATAPCMGGHWLHYPELIQATLGAAMYTVQNNGDGGAVLGCDATTAAVAGGNSFCSSSKYTDTMKTPPNIAIIGPFGEHDQRIVGASANNTTMLYSQAVFEKAYEGLVQKYLAVNAKVYMMTPVDVPWGGTPTLPAGDDLVKDIMLPAAIKVAGDHQIPVIDTYTAISGTPQLVTMYYGSDGQVTMAGQQKMADLIVAALQAPAMGGTGGMGGGGAGGSGGTGGAAAGAGGTGGSFAGSTGIAGAATGGVGTAGGPTGAGTGGVAVGAGGTSAVAGAAGTATTPITTPTSSSSDSSGCTLSGPSGSDWAGGVALLSLGLALFARKRRAS